MKMIRLIAELIGWCVIAMFLVGALDVADFSLSFGPGTDSIADTAPQRLLRSTVETGQK